MVRLFSVRLTSSISFFNSTIRRFYMIRIPKDLKKNLKNRKVVDLSNPFLPSICHLSSLPTKKRKNEIFSQLTFDATIFHDDERKRSAENNKNELKSSMKYIANIRLHTTHCIANIEKQSNPNILVLLASNL